MQQVTDVLSKIWNTWYICSKSILVPSAELQRSCHSFLAWVQKMHWAQTCKKIYKNTTHDTTLLSPQSILPLASYPGHVGWVWVYTSMHWKCSNYVWSDQAWQTSICYLNNTVNLNKQGDRNDERQYILSLCVHTQLTPMLTWSWVEFFLQRLWTWETGRSQGRGSLAPVSVQEWRGRAPQG